MKVFDYQMKKVHPKVKRCVCCDNRELWDIFSPIVKLLSELKVYVILENDYAKLCFMRKNHIWSGTEWYHMRSEKGEYLIDMVRILVSEDIIRLIKSDYELFQKVSDIINENILINK